LRLLLDTHIALWAITGDSRLPTPARALIEDPENDVVVSAASVWEIAIKHGLARGGANDMPVSGDEALKYFAAAGYILLNITPAQAAFVESLPRHHDDPFDRILVAQALLTPLRLITHDARLARYSDTVIRV
jgi:PIN domain nuclease of toxin-antitoxin system